MTKRYTLCLSSLLFFIVMFFSANSSAQCTFTAAEPQLPTLSPTCSNQTSATIGAGTYIYYTGFVPNTYYNISVSNFPGTLTCAQGIFTNSGLAGITSWYNIDGVTSTIYAPAGTTDLLVETAASSWNGTSAALNYSIATPSNPTWSSAPGTACLNGTVTYTVNASSNATAYVWTLSEGGTSDYINGVPGQTTITETTGTITVTYGDASAAAISVYATDNGFCNSNTISSPITITTPASISIQPSGSSICAGLGTTTSVGASGNSGLSYQWQYYSGGVWANVVNGIPAGVTYSGNTNSLLSITTTNTTPGGNYSYQCIIANGSCDPVTTNTAVINVVPSVFTTIPVSICPGGSYEGYTSAGTYVDTYQGSNGCDSIRTLNLTVLVNATDTVVGVICQGGSFGGYTTAGTYTQTYTGSNGCDSFYVTQVIVYPTAYSSLTQVICQGQTYDGYSATGVYIDTFASGNGCDSIRTLNLTVNPVSSSSITITLCSNENYDGHNSTGTFTDTFQAANGCDSIRTLHLTVLPVISTTVNQTICSNQSYYGYSSTGQFIDTLTGINGCDSIRTLNLTVLQVVSSSIATTVCPGQSYAGHGTTGTFIDTLSGSNGCDSIRTLNLIVLPIVTSTVAQSICPGQNYDGHSTTGTFVDTLTGQNGCDSIRTLNLTVIPNAVTRESKFICAGESYEGYDTTGIYIDTTTGQSGCDSFHILTLTVINVITTTVTQTICQGQNVDGHATNGTYVDTLTAATGCDSIRTLNLTVTSAAATALTDSICYGDTLMGHTTSGTYVDTLINSGGCDSIVTLNLTVLPVLGTPTVAITGTNIVAVNLAGDSYQWYLNGNAIPGDTTQSIVITASGLYSVKITNSNGCSITSLAINVIYTPTGIQEIAGSPKLSIFPNPSQGTLNIEADGLAAEAGINISIFDQLGRVAFEQVQTAHGTIYLTQVDLRNLANGVYIVQMQQGNNLVRQKLVIEK